MPQILTTQTHQPADMYEAYTIHFITGVESRGIPGTGAHLLNSLFFPFPL